MATGQKISSLNDGNPAEDNDLIPIARSGENYSVTAQSIAELATTTVTVAAGTPITVTGGSELSMASASASTNGYLTSTDWNTFNNKGSGAVTSVTGTSPIVSSGGATPAITFNPDGVSQTATTLTGAETVLVSQGGVVKKATANVAAKTLFGIYTTATLPAAASTAVGTTAWISDSGGSFVVNNGTAWVSTGGSISGNATNRGQLIGSDGTAAVYKKTRLNALFFGITQGSTTASDQTGAIQTFLDYCRDNNAAAYFPSGYYRIDGTLQYRVPVYGDRPKSDPNYVYGSGTIFWSNRAVRSTMWELPEGYRDWYFEGCQFQGSSPPNLGSNKVVAISSAATTWAACSTPTNPSKPNHHYAVKDCIFRFCGGAMEVVGWCGYISNPEISYCYSGFKFGEANAIIIDGGEAQGQSDSILADTFDIQIWGNPSTYTSGYIANILINQFTFESASAVALELCEGLQSVVLKSCYFEQPAGRTAIRAGVLGWNAQSTTKTGLHPSAVKYVDIGAQMYAPGGTKIVLDNVEGFNFDKATSIAGYVTKTALTKNVTNLPGKPREYSDWYSYGYSVYGTSNANYTTVMATEPPRQFGYFFTPPTGYAGLTGSTSTTITDDAQNWVTNNLIGSSLWITDIQENRLIVSNTADTLTVYPAFTNTPSIGSLYQIRPNIKSPVEGDVVNRFPNPHFEGGFRGGSDIFRKTALVSGTSCLLFGPDGNTAHGTRSNMYYLEEDTTITRTGKASLKYTRWNNATYTSISYIPCELILSNQSAFKAAAGNRVCISFWWYCPDSNSTVNGTRKLTSGLAYNGYDGTRVTITIWDQPVSTNVWQKVIRWFDVPKYGPSRPSDNPEFAFIFHPDEFSYSASGSIAVHYFDDLLVCVGPNDIQKVVTGDYVPYPVTTYNPNGDALYETSAAYPPEGFTIQAASVTNGSAAMTLTAANPIIKVGMPVTCNNVGIPSGTYVTAVSGISVTLSKNATNTLSTSFNFGTIAAYKVGDRVTNNNPVSGGAIGWVCTSAPVITLGSMVATQYTLTVPAGVTINNGDTVTVYGAGVSNATLITTVSSGGGTTTLTLAAAASTSVTDGTVMTTGVWKSYGTIA